MARAVVDGRLHGLQLGTGGVAGDDPQWRHGLAAELLEVELGGLRFWWFRGEGERGSGGVVLRAGNAGPFIGGEWQGAVAGMDKPRVARAACGRAWSATCRAREARARCLRVGGGVARFVVVGAGSVGAGRAGVAGFNGAR